MKLNNPLVFVHVLLFVLGTSALDFDTDEPRQKRISHAAQSLSQRERRNEASKFVRLFSLFNVVRFENKACSGTKSSIDNVGTCLSAAECVSSGGNTIGNCAAGFGICCGFSIVGCGGTVTQNCTFVRNEGFPLPTTETDTTCTYKFNRIDQNICQMRLDFQSTTTLPLATVPDGQCDGTGAVVRVRSGFSSNAAAFPPDICGQLTGQHLYFESGSEGNAGELSISLGTNPGPRQYNVKVSYIPCDSPLRAPSGCAQYFTGLTGTVTSYNFAGGQLLGGQYYNNCIRQLEGFCSFSVSESAIITPDPFRLSNANRIQDNCMMVSHILIPSSIPNYNPNFEVIPSMRCGGTFGSISGPSQNVPSTITSTASLVSSMRGCGFVIGQLVDLEVYMMASVPYYDIFSMEVLGLATIRALPNVPFVIGVRTLPADGGQLVDIGGFSLDYTQVPC